MPNSAAWRSMPGWPRSLSGNARRGERLRRWHRPRSLEAADAGRRRRAGDFRRLGRAHATAAETRGPRRERALRCEVSRRDRTLQGSPVSLRHRARGLGHPRGKCLSSFDPGAKSSTPAEAAFRPVGSGRRRCSSTTMRHIDRVRVGMSQWVNFARLIYQLAIEGIGEAMAKTTNHLGQADRRRNRPPAS